MPNLEILRKLTKYAFLRKDDIYYIVFIVPLIEESPLIMQQFYSIPKIIDNKATFLNLNELNIISDKKFERTYDFSIEMLNKNFKLVENIYKRKD